VDTNDLGALATNWLQNNKDWREGDFDYNGTIDVNDLGMLGTNWQAGVGGPLFAGGDPEEEFLEGIKELDLSQEQIEWLLSILGEGDGDQP
jgi:hypothetical protein